MSWKRHFNRAKRSSSPVAVDKQQVGPIPPGFEAQGLTVNGLWGVYERRQRHGQVRIIELPFQYRVSVSNPVDGGNKLAQSISQPNQDRYSWKRLAAVGVGILGAAAIGKASDGSQSGTTPDPKHAHRVFISHSWTYEDHFEEVKKPLDETDEFEYFDHSVSSENPIDAQLPNHLRKEIRDQMRSTSVVLVLGGMYVAHSDWIQEEIEMANQMDKPIIGVTPAENDRVPVVVQNHATELVQADGTEVMDAIERHAT